MVLTLVFFYHNNLKGQMSRSGMIEVCSHFFRIHIIIVEDYSNNMTWA